MVAARADLVAAARVELAVAQVEEQAELVALAVAEATLCDYYRTQIQKLCQLL